MSAATSAERSRAKYLRQRLKADQEISPNQRAWLDQYTERVSKRRNAPKGPDQTQVVRTPEQAGSNPAGSTPSPAVGSETRVPRKEAPGPAAGAGTKPPAVAMAPVSFPDDLTGPPVTHRPEAAPVCTIKDCPACKQHIAGQTCAVTGKTVWPPMAPEAAEMMARGLLSVTGLAIKMSRSDKLYTPATPKEQKQLATGLQIMQARRASWIGAVDDILLVVGALGGYGARAVLAPTQETNDGRTETGSRAAAE